MTQRDIFNVIKALGGHATVAEIKAAYRDVNDTRSNNHFATYVSEKLKRLRMWGYIEFAYEGRPRRGYYTIREEFGDGC